MLPPRRGVVTRLRGPVAWAVAAVGAVVFGYGLATVGNLFGQWGPLVMVLAVVVPGLGLAVLGDPRIGIFAVLAVFPIGFTPLPGLPLDLVQGAIVGMSVLVLVRHLGVPNRRPAWTPAYWWVVGLFVWTLVGTASAVDHQLALRRLLTTSAQLLFAVAIVAACRSRRDVRLVVAGLVTVVAFIGLGTIRGTGQIESGFGGAVVSGRATGIFSEPNQLGAFAAVAAVAAIGLALGMREKRHRWAAGGAAAVTVIALLLSLSRGAWIGFGLGMTVLLVAVPRARRVLAVGTLGLFVIALSYGALRPQSPEVHVIGERFKSFTGEKNPYDDRPTVWAEARREIAADPLTGHGLGNFPLVAQRSTSQAHTTFPPHAHNLYLNWAAETGVPAVAAILGFAAHLGLEARRALRRMRRQGRRRDAAVLGGLAGAAVVALGQGLVDYTLWSTVVMTELWLVVGALAAMIELERE